VLVQKLLHENLNLLRERVDELSFGAGPETIWNSLDYRFLVPLQTFLSKLGPVFHLAGVWLNPFLREVAG